MARPKAFDEDTALMRAMELFWEQGYAGASLTQLTASMGISRQSLYDTYGDKHGLFLKALDRYCALIGGRMLTALSGDTPGLAEIKATIAALIDFLVAYPKPRACLLCAEAKPHHRHRRSIAEPLTAESQTPLAVMHR